MQIHVSEIPEQGIFKELSTHLESNEFSCRDKATAQLELTKTGKSVFLRGTLSADIFLTCSRCLENYLYHVDTTMESCYVPLNERSDKKEHELTKDDLDVSFYSDDVIDLKEFLIEQILLTLPMRTLCNPDCKGLCHICGHNLNKSSCNCKEDRIDPRLSVLEKLIKKP
jgi:uncharacterized protein